VGAVTEIVRRYVPATYNEMIVKPSGADLLFSASDLQALANYVKFRLFSTSVSEGDEESAWNLGVRQFIGKLTTLQYIPAAIDYWDSRLATKNTTGTNEVITYRDHRDGLLNLYDSLTKEVKEDSIELGFSTKVHGLLPGVSYGDGGRGILVTPDPMDWPQLRTTEEIILFDGVHWTVNE
jgi:hypothetical protein